jgi:hypothetical protein
VLDYVGTGSDFNYIWGSQLELGPAANTYVPTTTTPITVGNSFVMQVSADIPAIDGVDRTAMCVRDASGLNEYRMRRASGNDTLITVTAAGVNQNITPGNGFTGARTIRWAARNRLTTTRLAVDAALRAETTLSNTPVSLDRIILGYASTGFSFLNGYIPRLQILGDEDDNYLRQLAA